MRVRSGLCVRACACVRPSCAHGELQGPARAHARAREQYARSIRPPSAGTGPAHSMAVTKDSESRSAPASANWLAPSPETPWRSRSTVPASVPTASSEAGAPRASREKAADHAQHSAARAAARPRPGCGVPRARFAARCAAAPAAPPPAALAIVSVGVSTSSAALASAAVASNIRTQSHVSSARVGARKMSRRRDAPTAASRQLHLPASTLALSAAPSGGDQLTHVSGDGSGCEATSRAGYLGAQVRSCARVCVRAWLCERVYGCAHTSTDARARAQASMQTRARARSCAPTCMCTSTQARDVRIRVHGAALIAVAAALEVLAPNIGAAIAAGVPISVAPPSAACGATRVRNHLQGACRAAARRHRLAERTVPRLRAHARPAFAACDDRRRASGDRYEAVRRRCSGPHAARRRVQRQRPHGPRSCARASLHAWVIPTNNHNNNNTHARARAHTHTHTTATPAPSGPE